MKTTTLQEMKDLIRKGTNSHSTWRLHSLSEEANLKITGDLTEGKNAFEMALKLFGEGDREGATEALRTATACAGEAIEAIEG